MNTEIVGNLILSNSILTSIPDEYYSYDETILHLSDDGYSTNVSAEYKDGHIFLSANGNVVGDVDLAQHMDRRLSSYLPLSGGNMVGDLSVSNADVKILSGNIVIQTNGNTTQVGYNTMCVGDNNIILGNNNMVIGSDNIVGTSGWKVVDYSEDNLTIDIEMNEEEYSEISAEILNEYFALVTTGSARTDCKIEDIQHIGSNRARITTNKYDNALAKLNNGENIILYVPSKPLLGNQQSVDKIFVSGQDNTATGNYSHSEGRDNKSIGNYAHSEGKETVASWGAHSEGNKTQALKVCSHAEGRFTIADEYMAHSQNLGTSALGCASTAAGVNACAKYDDAASFVWQGWNSKRYTATEVTTPNLPAYFSHGPGTFNINPINGLSGFYIGISSLNDIIEAKVAEILNR